MKPFVLAVLAVLAQGQVASPEVARARTAPLAPKAKPPAWMDFAKLQAGYAFLGRHAGTAVQTIGTSSLAATFAARDIAPVLMQTKRLPQDFQARMKETEAWMGEILDTPKSRADFAAHGYARAVDLGRLHAAVAGMVRGPLAWSPKERVPVNGQSYALVLYTFAWHPVEAMVATKELDPAKEAAGLDGWFHLWSTVGYAMGVPESLLPRDYAAAGRIAPLLRAAQYPAPGEAPPAGADVLLGGQVDYVAAVLYGRLKAQGKAPEKPEALRPLAALALANSIKLSPGLTEALGLGDKPSARLLEYANRPKSLSR